MHGAVGVILMWFLAMHPKILLHLLLSALLFVKLAQYIFWYRWWQVHRLQPPRVDPYGIHPLMFSLNGHASALHEEIKRVCAVPRQQEAHTQSPVPQDLQ